MKEKKSIRVRLSLWMNHFQMELKKTSSIGKKMLTASRTNAHLKDTYEELGKLLEKGVDNGEVDWDSARLRALLHTVKACKRDLEEIERKMNTIKFPSIDIKKDD